MYKYQNLVTMHLMFLEIDVSGKNIQRVHSRRIWIHYLYMMIKGTMQHEILQRTTLIEARGNCKVLLQSHSVLGIVTICHILSCWSLTPCDSAKYLWQRGLTRGFETRPKPFLFILMREMCSVAKRMEIWMFNHIVRCKGALYRREYALIKICHDRKLYQVNYISIVL